ncbi:MAG TPA: hypothetical protein PLV33_09125 [Opitutaceae bacterium]|nr:hypothetical protein [Opitutaceae bacterium]HOR25599.1 hypothetical protein [Opitutaceae bacterium]HPK50558.1 hypothetical protein [Opitutaceae bacterium]
MSDTNSLFGECIYSYSRSQALADGVLVDLSEIETIKAHWKYPFACSAMVWEIIEAALQKDGQDLNGICHDISWMALIAVRTGRQGAGQIHFKVIIAGTKHALKLHIGPGDDPAPVLTLMLPSED